MDNIELNPELAYLLGAYLSDGWMDWSREDLKAVWQVKDKPFADSIAAALTCLEVPYTYRDNRAKGRLITVRERARSWLGWWLEGESPSKTCLPEIPRELVRPLVAGLMDGDGCVGSSPSYQVTFAGAKSFVWDFRRLLTELGVKQGKIQWSGVPHWTIDKMSFLATGLCFAMPRKQKRLASWCGRSIRTARAGCPWGRGGAEGIDRRAAVAEWWMKNVYAWESPNIIPQGSGSFA